MFSTKFHILKISWSVFALFATTLSIAQNLVTNPSFEEYTELPDRQDQIEFAKGWRGINGADYYHRNALPPFYSASSNSNNMSVPENQIGYQEPKTGDAYAGIFVWPDPEILSTKLSRPLKNGERYKIKFYVSRCDKPKWAITQMGCYISAVEVDVMNFYYKYDKSKKTNIEPQIVSPPNVYIVEAEDWYEISGAFTANGGEQYLYIGCFLPPESNKVKRIKRDRVTSPMALYYIDDVSVYELDSLGNPILEAPADEKTTKEP